MAVLLVPTPACAVAATCSQRRSHGGGCCYYWWPKKRSRPADRTPQDYIPHSRIRSRPRSCCSHRHGPKHRRSLSLFHRVSILNPCSRNSSSPSISISIAIAATSWIHHRHDFSSLLLLLLRAMIHPLCCLRSCFPSPIFLLHLRAAAQARRDMAVQPHGLRSLMH